MNNGQWAEGGGSERQTRKEDDERTTDLDFGALRVLLEVERLASAHGSDLEVFAVELDDLHLLADDELGGEDEEELVQQVEQQGVEIVPCCVDAKNTGSNAALWGGAHHGHEPSTSTSHWSSTSTVSRSVM